MGEKTMTVKRGLSRSALKLIAMSTMLIDHIGAVVLYPILVQTAQTGQGWVQHWSELVDLYTVMRQIGRVAFPIFCFQLVEGFQRTGNKYRYALRLFLFALISEIPFDLALEGVMLETGYQNVMFTLFFGLLVMITCDKLENLERNGKKMNKWFLLGLEIIVVYVGMKAADFMNTDYAGFGVLCISVLYYFRHNRTWQLIQGSVAFIAGEQILMGTSSELLAPLGFIPVALYHGDRGARLKYLYYFFYPMHLIVLYGIRMLLM